MKAGRNDFYSENRKVNEGKGKKQAEKKDLIGCARTLGVVELLFYDTEIIL